MNRCFYFVPFIILGKHLKYDAFKNDVMQFYPKVSPPQPSVTLKLMFDLQTYCHKMTYPLLDFMYEWPLKSLVA